jgi:hypothetical protein
MSFDQFSMQECMKALAQCSEVSIAGGLSEYHGYISQKTACVYWVTPALLECLRAPNCPITTVRLNTDVIDFMTAVGNGEFPSVTRLYVNRSPEIIAALLTLITSPRSSLKSLWVDGYMSPEPVRELFAALSNPDTTLRHYWCNNFADYNALGFYIHRTMKGHEMRDQWVII